MIEKFFLACLLLILPFQLGRHFWPGFSYVFGLKVDYLSPTIYLQDIVSALLIGFLAKKSFKKSFRTKGLILPVCYLVLATTNIFLSIDKTVSFLHWVRITEFVLVGVIICQNTGLVWKILLKIVPFWVLTQFIAGLIQVFRQSSIGGIFWLLGERSFNIFTPGIAKAFWIGRIFLRPYGTFSHPNSIAGFILICLIILLLKKKLQLLDKITVVCGAVLLVLCFSRTIWLTVFLLSLFFLFWQIIKGFRNTLSLSFVYLFSILTVLGGIFLFKNTTIESASFVFRQKLAVFALETIKNHAFFGIGANTFILQLSKSENAWQWLAFLQPVHNIFLLIASEAGLIGLLSFFAFLVVTFQKLFQSSTPYHLPPITFALLAILFTGLFDHYWLTLIQNQLLFVVLIGLSWGKTSDKMSL